MWIVEERQNPTSQAEQPTQDFNHRAYQWIKKHPLPALLMAGVAVAVLVIAYWAFWPASAPEEAGFVYTVPAPEQELYRTLWDWLELLIVPLAVASGAAFISFVQKRTELDIADQARKTEQQITTNRLRQATLEAYYDRMTELLLEYDLRASADYSEARSIARARTVAVVRGLDGERNRQLFAFLRTSQLIEKDMPIVDLRKADLSGAEAFETKEEKGRYVFETLRAHAQSTQGPILNWLEQNGIEHRSFYIVNGLWVKAGRDAALQLGAREDVSRIEGNPVIHGIMPVERITETNEALTTTKEAVETGLNFIRAPEVWAAGFTGQGIVIGGQDTGVRWDHAALQSKYRGWNGSSASHDYNWHDSIHSGGGACAYARRLDASAQPDAVGAHHLARFVFASRHLLWISLCKPCATTAGGEAKGTHATGDEKGSRGEAACHCSCGSCSSRPTHGHRPRGCARRCEGLFGLVE